MSVRFYGANNGRRRLRVQSQVLEHLQVMCIELSVNRMAYYNPQYFVTFDIANVKYKNTLFFGHKESTVDYFSITCTINEYFNYDFSHGHCTYPII